MDTPLPPGARVTIVVVDDHHHEVEVARLSSLRPDMDLVDRLARLRLAAARLGLDVQLRDPCTTLAGVLALSGLSEVLCGSVEVVGQPELGEVGDVEEVGPAGDAAV